MSSDTATNRSWPNGSFGADALEPAHRQTRQDDTTNKSNQLPLRHALMLPALLAWPCDESGHSRKLCTVKQNHQRHWVDHMTSHHSRSAALTHVPWPGRGGEGEGPLGNMMKTLLRAVKPWVEQMEAPCFLCNLAPVKLKIWLLCDSPDVRWNKKPNECPGTNRLVSQTDGTAPSHPKNAYCLVLPRLIRHSSVSQHSKICATYHASLMHETTL